MIKPVLREVNSFSEETSIHGFSYLSKHRHWLTKIIWSALLGTALTLAVLMIQQNFIDAENHPLSTTLDTISVTDVPFPAVTIFPGHYGKEMALFKRMFDYLQFERYEETDELRNNTEFLRIWGSALMMGDSSEVNWSARFLDYTIAKIKGDNHCNSTLLF